jgi:hypothetical protein
MKSSGHGGSVAGLAPYFAVPVAECMFLGGTAAETDDVGG